MKITNKKNLRNLLLILFFFALLVFSFILYNRGNKDTNQEATTSELNFENSSNDSIEKEEYKFPEVYLSIKSVDNEKIQTYWGDEDSWTNAIVDMGSTTQPYKQITLPKEVYSTEIDDLPKEKSWDETVADIKKYVSLDIDKSDDINDYTELFMENYSVKESFKEYGSLATRFLPEQRIAQVDYLDLDKDGKNEEIVQLCDNAGNHQCITKVLVIKNNKIIFSAKEGERPIVGVDVDKKNNSFTLKWSPDDGEFGDAPLCCDIGHRSTKFTFSNNKVIPVSETETRYVMVYNIDAEPYQPAKYIVPTNFKNIKPIQFTGDYKLLEEYDGYWNDWKTIFANYGSTSANNFAGHYKFFELPNGNFINFGIVDVTTGKIYGNDFNFVGGAKYFYQPNSKLLKVIVPNNDFYLSVDEEIKKNPALGDTLEDNPNVYLYFILENNEIKFLGEYVLSDSKFYKIDNAPRTVQDGTTVE